MYSYTASIFWLLSWPVLILIVFFVSRWALKKLTPLLEDQQENESTEQKQDQPQTAEE